MLDEKGHLISISEASEASVLSFFQQISKNKSKGFSYAQPVLKNETVSLLFLEPSTRTRISFEIAAQKLGAQTVLIQKEGSSLEKGETILDTFQTIHAMGCRMFVYRSPDSSIQEISKHFGKKIALLNAGDGSNEHPTQALIDGFTIWENYKAFDKIKIAILGDVARSRVAHSDITLFNMLGNKPFVSGPPELLKNFSKDQVNLVESMEEAIADADVVMMLRIQSERKDVSYQYKESDYLKSYGLTQQRLKLAKPKAIVMHPGPFHRNVEIESSVADGPQSVILNQVHNGVWIRMGVFEEVRRGLS
jgi:aspartate carbamoyltransferase catalytic subunit